MRKIQQRESTAGSTLNNVSSRRMTSFASLKSSPFDTFVSTAAGIVGDFFRRGLFLTGETPCQLRVQGRAAALALTQPVPSCVATGPAFPWDGLGIWAHSITTATPRPAFKYDGAALIQTHN